MGKSSLTFLAEWLRESIGCNVGVALCYPLRIASFRIEPEIPKGVSRIECLNTLKHYKKILDSSGLISRVVVAYPNLYVDLDTDFFSETLWESTKNLHGDNLNFSAEVGGKLCNISCCSPNLNKPLHLGHARNLAIGGALSKIYRASGQRVEMTATFSDYGIHIAQAVAAYEEDGACSTPEKEGLKGDFFVGGFYKKGSKIIRRSDRGSENFLCAQKRLLNSYVENNPHALELFHRLTNWAVFGIKLTFERFHSRFDRFFSERQAITLCQEILEKGLSNGTMARDSDGSVWVAGLPKSAKGILTRSDGTPLYLLQRLASLLQRQNAYGPELALYISVLGLEQVPFFNLFSDILKLLKFPLSFDRHITAYGLVYDGKERMKSREGNVITLDKTLDELEKEYSQNPPLESQDISFTRKLSVGVLRTYLLSHSLKKPVYYNQKDLIHVCGKLFIRTCRLLKRARGLSPSTGSTTPLDDRKRVDLLREILRYNNVLNNCLNKRDPTPMVTYLNTLCEKGFGYIGLRGKAAGRPEERFMLSQTIDKVLYTLDLPTSRELFAG